MLPGEGLIMPSRKERPAREKYGKCPVEAQLSDEAVRRVMANELLCGDEYGVGVGDPQVGWWSVNWVNTPAMAPGPPEREPNQESPPPPSK
jgi:hypothetical protein